MVVETSASHSPVASTAASEASSPSPSSPPPRRDVRTRSATPLPPVAHDDEGGHREALTGLEERVGHDKEANVAKGNGENGRSYGTREGGVVTAIQQPKVQGSLLDVDLIRGSSAFHTKPAKDTAQLRVGALRVLLYPAFYHWWREQGQSAALFACGCVLYLLQFAIVLLYTFQLLPVDCPYLHPPPLSYAASPHTLAPVMGKGKKAPPPPQSCSFNYSDDQARLVRLEIFLPLLLGACCALGYGHLVAASNDGSKRGRPLPAFAGKRDGNGTGVGADGGVRAGGEEEEEESDVEDPYGEELREKEQKILLQAASATGQLNPLAAARAQNPSSPSYSETPSPPPARQSPVSSSLRPPRTQPRYSSTEDAYHPVSPRPKQHRPSASIDAAEREEEGMWGLGRTGIEGTAAMGAVRVTLFDHQGDSMKVPMTLSQVRAYIVDRAGSLKQGKLYRFAAPMAAVTAAALPTLFATWQHLRLHLHSTQQAGDGDASRLLEGLAMRGLAGLLRSLPGELPLLAWQALRECTLCDAQLAVIRLVSLGSVLFIAWPTFLQLAMAESTYSQRYQYAKYFAAITSLTKARRYNIPHFSLKNVLNIKMWLALRAGRSWLRRYPRQRIADTIVLSTFRSVLLLLAMLCFEVFMRQEKRPFLSELLHWELMVWGGFSSLYLLRYMVVGSRINAKYSADGTTTLLTEQVNVQLRIFENCSRTNDRHKRERLQIANSVLKLTQKLLKENDSSPNKLSGFSMNPVLYNITRVVLLSALSAAASDVMGFKLKMWKLLKIK